MIDLSLSEAAGHSVVAALRNSADGYLEKPYELELCLAKAQTLLRRYTELTHIAERGYAVVCHEQLRRKLGSAELIEAVHGVGYRLKN